jgi:hypothetical protein
MLSSSRLYLLDEAMPDIPISLFNHVFFGKPWFLD